MYIALPSLASSTAVSFTVRTLRGFAPGPKILDEVGQQFLTILERPVPRPLRAVAEEAVSVRLGRAVVKLLANHPVDAGVPHLRTRRLRRQEVLAVTNHARALRDLASASRRVHVVIGVERHEYAVRRRALEVLGDVGFRFGVCWDVGEREPETGRIAGLDGQPLNVGLQASRGHTDFVVPRE